MGFKPTSGGGIDQLTGEVTAGPGTGSQSATIAPVTTAGSIGGATAVPEITYNDAGQITGVASVAPNDISKVPLATVTAAGDLIVGSGAGAVSRLGIGANGDVLTVASGALSYAAPAAGALTYETGVLSAAVSIPANAWTTILTTPSLATGVWLIVINALIYPAASPTAIEQWAVGYNQSGPGTATVTTLMGGGQSNVWMPIGAPASSGSAASGRHVGLLQVTAAGTILIQMYSPVAANAAIDGNETSFQAIKIA